MPSLSVGFDTIPSLENRTTFVYCNIDNPVFCFMSRPHPGMPLGLRRVYCSGSQNELIAGICACTPSALLITISLGSNPRASSPMSTATSDVPPGVRRSVIVFPTQSLGSTNSKPCTTALCFDKRDCILCIKSSAIGGPYAGSWLPLSSESYNNQWRGFRLFPAQDSSGFRTT